MKKKIYCMLGILLLSTVGLSAQVTIGVNRDPSPGTILELVSSDKGLLLPSVTSTERNNLSTAGLIVYNATTGSIEFCCSGGQWKTLKKNGQAATNVAKVTTAPSHSSVSGVKISDTPSSTIFSKESVLELESSGKALALPVVTSSVVAKKGLLCFKLDSGSTTSGKLYYSEDGANWLTR